MTGLKPTEGSTDPPYMPQLKKRWHNQSLPKRIILTLVTIATVLVAFRSNGATELVYIEGANFGNSGLARTAAVAHQKGWKASFLAPHSNTPELESHYGYRLEDSSQAAVFAKIDELQKRLRQKERKNPDQFTSQDQLLLVVRAHGRINPDTGEHEIQLADGIVSLTKKIEATLELARKKGVRVGLVLDNCFSGDALNSLLRDVDLSKTCVITGSESGRGGFTSSYTSLFGRLIEAPSLETAFLEARRASKETVSQPMISSPAGIQTARKLSVVKNFHFYRGNSVQANADRLCTNNSSLLTELGELTEKIELLKYKKYKKQSSSSAPARAHVEQLQTHAKATEELDERIREKEGRLQKLRNERPCEQASEETLRKTGTSSTDELCALVNADLNLLEHWERLQHLVRDKMNDAGNLDRDVFYDIKGQADDQIYSVSSNSAKKRLEKLKTAQLNPTIKDLRRRTAKSERAIADLAKEIDDARNDPRLGGAATSYNPDMMHERALYDAIYDQYSKELYREPNPCRDFKL